MKCNSIIFFGLVFLFLGIQTEIQAQFERRGYIGIALGSAIPVGAFADDDINNANSGYANAGTGISLIDFGYKFGNRFGISAAIGGAVFSIGDESLDISLIQAGLYIGPIISFPITEDLDLNIIPRLASLSTSITQGDEELFEESSTGFDLVAALQYDLSWRWSLTLYSSYTQSQVEDNLKVSSVNVNIGIAYRLK